MKRVVVGAILFLAILYICDYLSLRFRIPGNREPFGLVQVQRYYAVPQKDGKTQFLFDQPESETCVHSLFPHLGDAPCWYAGRKKEKRINM